MPPRPRPKVYFCGRARNTEGDHIVTLSVNATRYEYILNGPAADTTEYLCKRVSALKALAYAKSRARLVLRQ